MSKGDRTWQPPGSTRRFVDTTVLSAEQARLGKELGVMRYVLHISLALSVIAGVVNYATFFH
jgi:hypothetical protein